MSNEITTTQHPGFEIFYFVPCLPENYRVSNFGRVKSLARTILKTDGRKKAIAEKILRQQVNPHGYATVSIRPLRGKKKVWRVHQLVARAFITDEHYKPIVNHKDGNKLNNHVSNLEWVTYTENIQHAYDTGLRTANTVNAVISRRKNKSSTLSPTA